MSAYPFVPPNGVRAQAHPQSCVADLATRLSRACPGWSLYLSADGYVLSPPGGDEALIGTQAALEDWLRHQERWAHESAHDEPLIEQMEMELL